MAVRGRGATGKTVFAGLEGDRQFEASRSLAATAGGGGVALGAPQGDRFTVSINETWNEAAPQEILGRMQRALG